MCTVGFSILFPLVLVAVCGGYRIALVPEDKSMDPVLELLLQEKLEFETLSTESASIDEGKGMRFVEEEWRCGTCKDLSRLLYTETIDLQLNSVPASPHAEFQIGVALDELISCARVSGAAALHVSVTDGGCDSAGLTLALRTRNHIHNDVSAAAIHAVALRLYG